MATYTGRPPNRRFRRIAVLTQVSLVAGSGPHAEIRVTDPKYPELSIILRCNGASWDLRVAFLDSVFFSRNPTACALEACERARKERGYQSVAEMCDALNTPAAQSEI